MIDTEAIGIEVFWVNAQGHWELEEYRSIDKTLVIHDVNVMLSLKEIYEETKL